MVRVVRVATACMRTSKRNSHVKSHLNDLNLNHHMKFSPKKHCFLGTCWRWRKTSLWPFFPFRFALRRFFTYLPAFSEPFGFQTAFFAAWFQEKTSAWNAKYIHVDAIKTFIIIITIAIFKCFMFALQIFSHSVFRIFCRVYQNTPFFVVYRKFRLTHGDTQYNLHLYRFFVCHYQINIEISDLYASVCLRLPFGSFCYWCQLFFFLYNRIWIEVSLTIVMLTAGSHQRTFSILTAIAKGLKENGL